MGWDKISRNDEVQPGRKAGLIRPGAIASRFLYILKMAVLGQDELGLFGATVIRTDRMMSARHAVRAYETWTRCLLHGDGRPRVGAEKDLRG